MALLLSTALTLKCVQDATQSYFHAVSHVHILLFPCSFICCGTLVPNFVLPSGASLSGKIRNGTFRNPKYQPCSCLSKLHGTKEKW